MVFLKNHTQDVVEGPVPDHFIKKIKIKHISEYTVSNVTMFTFIVCPYRVLPKYIKTKVLTTCF